MAARYTLETEVQYVKGVGTKLAQVLSKLNLYTLGDLLFHLPRRYEDRRQFRKIAHARPGDAVTVSGKLVTVDNVKVRNLTLTKAYLDDGSGVLELVWYNQPYMKDTLTKLRNSQIVAYGIIKESPYGLQMETPEWEDLPDGADPDSLLSVNRIVPIYPLTEGIRQKRMRQIIWNAVQYAHLAPEILPRSVRERLGLMPIQQAIAQIHFPDSEQAIDPARQRLVFEEFFLMQLGVGMQRQRTRQERGIAMRIDADRLNEMLHRIVPFELTNAQKRVIREIWSDMAQPHPMNRLLQGDVGSGKTIVAAAAILAAVDNQYQAAMMAPTEILAEQHYINLHRLFQPLGISVELLVGRLSNKQRQQARERIATGRGMVAVGTHALIQEGVSFARLGLAIVDEQHRFGVLQRAALRDKGVDAPCAGDDRHAHPAHADPHPVRRAGCVDYRRAAPWTQARAHPLEDARRATQSLRRRAQTDSGGATGVCDLPANRRVGQVASARRRSDGGTPPERCVPRPARGAVARAHEARREGSRDGRLPRGRVADTRLHNRD
jgi:ATP-dependent DNA helicase RecG